MADESVENLNTETNFDRKATVFPIDNQVLMDPDDEFYTVTTRDAIAIQKRLQEVSKLLSNPPLVSQSKLRDAEMERKRSSWKVTIIKVKLPQQWILQATFRSDEPVKNVHEFVRCCLANPDAPFTLVLLPGRTIVPSEEGLIEADAVLKPEILKMTTSSSAALTHSLQSLSGNQRFSPLTTLSCEEHKDAYSLPRL
uniref:UBX domain-containing protein n=1 Tax=Trichuris muris TaxID=70415 RepID=A0A5S6QUQ7_TRIMR